MGLKKTPLSWSSCAFAFDQPLKGLVVLPRDGNNSVDCSFEDVVVVRALSHEVCKSSLHSVPIGNVCSRLFFVRLLGRVHRSKASVGEIADDNCEWDENDCLDEHEKYSVRSAAISPLRCPVRMRSLTMVAKCVGRRGRPEDGSEVVGLP
jgi:hypothetical protein